MLFNKVYGIVVTKCLIKIFYFCILIKTSKSNNQLRWIWICFNSGWTRKFWPYEFEWIYVQQIRFYYSFDQIWPTLAKNGYLVIFSKPNLGTELHSVKNEFLKSEFIWDYRTTYEKNFGAIQIICDTFMALPPPPSCDMLLFFKLLFSKTSRHL